MARIEESSRKVTDIIGVIDEIARQTNLLALNAAVEAARAGEAGRGFAVVASEVRTLAQRSSEAAKDIKQLISNSGTQVQEGVQLVNQTGTALSEIAESVKKAASIISEIAAASSEQATGLDQINKAITQMDGVTQQNSALVEENAATAKTLEYPGARDGETGCLLPLQRGGRGRRRADADVGCRRGSGGRRGRAARDFGRSLNPLPPRPTRARRKPFEPSARRPAGGSYASCRQIALDRPPAAPINRAMKVRLETMLRNIITVSGRGSDAPRAAQ